MTIYAAIKYYKDLADDIDKNPLSGDDSAEARQLVKWLEELKAIKEGAVFYSNRPIEDIVLEARNDTIDEFVKAIEKHQTRQDYYFKPPYVKMSLDMVDVLEVAQQLKEKK